MIGSLLGRQLHRAGARIKAESTNASNGRSASIPIHACIAGIALGFLSPISQAAELSVIQGSGSGSYATGERAYIVANPTEFLSEEAATTEPLDPAATTRIFDRWIGDTQHLEDPFAPRTSLLMSASDLAIMAQFKDGARWISAPTLTFVPPSPERIIYLMHGTEGCATCIANNTNIKSFIKDANSRGYAVVIPEAYDRHSRAWHTNPEASQNVDMQRIATLHQDLIARGVVNTSSPVHLVGVSGGGSFASLFDQEAQSTVGFFVESMAFALSPGEASEMLTLDVPTVIAVAENDTGFSLDIAVTTFSNLVSRDVPAQLIIGKPGPLSDNYFWPVSGIDSFESKSIVNELRQQGFLDASDFLLENPRNSGWELAIGHLLESDKELSQVKNLLMQSFAEHGFMDSFSHPILAFLETPVIAVDIIPEVTGFSPASAAPGEQITVAGQFFVDVQSVAIGGAAAQFIQSLSHELIAVVPEGAAMGPVTVTNSAGTGVSAAEFGVSGAEITSVSTWEGPVGTIVEIGGSGLVGLQSVTFNGVSANFNGFTPFAMAAVVPPGASDGALIVTTSSGSIYAGEFDVSEAPLVTGLNTNKAFATDLVTISGEHLMSVTEVKLGDDILASFTVVSGQEIVFEMPTGLAGPTGIVLQSPNGPASAGWIYAR